MLQDRERWSGRAASALRERACAPAATPSPQRMETLGSLRVSGFGVSRPEIPDWLIEICKQRDWFRRTALRVMREGQERWYLVLFDCQRPFQLSCLPLTPRLVTVGRPNMGEQEIYACMSRWHVYTFTVVERVFLCSSPFRQVDPVDVSVLPHVRLGAEWCAWSDGEMILSLEFLEELPRPGRGEGSAKRHMPEGPSARDVVARHPWAAKYLRAEADEPYDDGPPEQPCHAVHREEISEEALVDIWNSVVEERLAHEVERGGVRVDVFVTVLRGGAWTAAHRGVAVDSLRADGRGQEAALFCRTYSLPKSCTFAFSVYSRADAAWLGRLWCHKNAVDV